MPHRRCSRRSNHFLVGFSVGIVIGALLFLFASGSWGLIIVNPLYTPFGRFLLLLFYLSAWALGIYNAVKRKAFIDNYVDGFVIGCALTAQTLSWIRYGIQIPWKSFFYWLLMRQSLQEQNKRVIAVSILIYVATIALAMILHGILFQERYDLFILLPLVVFSFGYSVDYLIKND